MKSDAQLIKDALANSHYIDTRAVQLLSLVGAANAELSYTEALAAERAACSLQEQLLDLVMRFERRCGRPCRKRVAR